MPAQTQKLFDRIERSHKNLLERIDRLDQQITELLQNWTQGDTAAIDIPKTDPSAEAPGTSPTGDNPK